MGSIYLSESVTLMLGLCGGALLSFVVTVGWYWWYVNQSPKWILPLVGFSQALFMLIILIFMAVSLMQLNIFFPSSLPLALRILSSVLTTIIFLPFMVAFWVASQGFAKGTEATIGVALMFYVFYLLAFDSLLSLIQRWRERDYMKEQH